MVGTRPRMRSCARASCATASSIRWCEWFPWDGEVRARSSETQTRFRAHSRRLSASCFGGRLRGAFAIERNQIGADGFRAKLTQQRGNLAAMIGAVVREVLQHLPQRRGLRHAGRSCVMNYALHFFRRQGSDVIAASRDQFQPSARARNPDLEIAKQARRNSASARASVPATATPRA